MHLKASDHKCRGAGLEEKFHFQNPEEKQGKIRQYHDPGRKDAGGMRCCLLLENWDCIMLD